jgi:coenzyme F420-dependent glucose-6-phosphate dehydrogenase
VIDAYREARARAGREGDGEIVFQALVSWAPSDDEAFEQARKWKGAQPPDHFTDDWHRPQEMYEHGEAEVSDAEFAQNIIAASDPAEIQERLRALEQLGGTVITLQNNSGPHAERAIELLGGQVLPALRRARV